MRILVIDDERESSRSSPARLQAERFTVDTRRRDGALRGMRRNAYDLVLLDLLLPGVDGLTVLEELSHSQHDLPVLIVSARSDLPTKLRGFGLGAADYVSKPFSLPELLARIRVALRRSHASDGGHVLQAGELSLDLACPRSPDRTRHATHLTDREFRLLHHLAEHPGQGGQPRTASVRGLGLSLRPGIERRRRLRPPAAQEARGGRTKSKRFAVPAIAFTTA